MVNVAQLVEHQIVALVVVGSTPTIHPIILKKFASKKDCLYTKAIQSGRGAIGSVLALGARGCQFESGRPDHFFSLIIL